MVHPKMQYTYCGIDSHKESHTAVFLDCFFEKLGEISFENRQCEFNKFLNDAEKFQAEGTALFFGLEDVSSFGRSLTVFLKDNNQLVKHVNAYLVAKERKNQNVVEKTDSVDAECVARLLISKFSSLPDADPDENFWLLRTLVVQRDFIVNTNVRLKTYLHNLLTQDFPSYRNFFYELDGKTSLAFFTKYPSPGMLKDVSVEELGQFIAKTSRGLIGLQRAQEILDSIDTSAPIHPIRCTTIQSTIRQLKFNLNELSETEDSLAEVYSEFNATLTSMTGIDVVTASQILSCIGDIKKFPTPAKLARYAGIAPVSYSSGKKDSRFTNTRGNRELNCLFYRLAVRLIVTFEPGHKAVNPFFHEYYHRKMSEGKTKRQALKCVQRRLVNIIWTMLTNNEEYVNPPMIGVERPNAKSME